MHVLLTPSVLKMHWIYSEVGFKLNDYQIFPLYKPSVIEIIKKSKQYIFDKKLEFVSNKITALLVRLQLISDSRFSNYL